MKFAMLQARAIWLDRAVRLGFKRAPTCQGPPIYESLTQNAYIFTASSGACVTMLQGLYSGAFADARFDDKSLASRLIWVAAHEFSHQTLVTNWNTVNVNALLARYHRAPTQRRSPTTLRAAVVRQAWSRRVHLHEHRPDLVGQNSVRVRD